MKTKGKLREKQGISLIVLVITIIVIIILAVAVILSIANNNPISNAKKAQVANNAKTLEESANLAYSDWYTKSKLNQTTKKPSEYVAEILQTQGFNSDEIATVAATEDGVSIVTIPNGFVASKADGENQVAKGLVIYEGNTPVTNENVSEARKTRNQFVWVPVNNISNFVRQEFKDTPLSTEVAEYLEPYSEAEVSEVAEYNAMMESVSKYHGFYIGRYEASKSSEEKAQSIGNQTPWDGIKWGTSMTDLSDGAVEASRAVYPSSEANEGEAISTLVYGVQWDQTIRFLEENYPGISNDSTGMGYYVNKSFTSPIKTGSNTSYAQNNIYDMCGNVGEWTMESNVDSRNDTWKYRVLRGGFRWKTGDVQPISYRGPSSPTGYVNFGFRLALYVK